jgi:large subunit ribosomal protein L29
MRADELRGRDPDDLRDELRQLRRALFDLKFQWQAEEKPDTSQRRRLKRDIARVLTILKEMETASGTGGHSVR